MRAVGDDCCLFFLFFVAFSCPFLQLQLIIYYLFKFSLPSGWFTCIHTRINLSGHLSFLSLVGHFFTRFFTHFISNSSIRSFAHPYIHAFPPSFSNLFLHLPIRLLSLPYVYEHLLPYSPRIHTQNPHFTQEIPLLIHPFIR